MVIFVPVFSVTIYGPGKVHQSSKTIKIFMRSRSSVSDH